MKSRCMHWAVGCNQNDRMLQNMHHNVIVMLSVCIFVSQSDVDLILRAGLGLSV